MKTTILVLAVVLVGLMAAPSPSAAIYPFCPDCAIYQMGPNANCTCPGTGPRWIFTKCGTYPAGCELPAVSAVSDRSDLEGFLITLAGSPEVPAAAL